MKKGEICLSTLILLLLILSGCTSVPKVAVVKPLPFPSITTAEDFKTTINNRASHISTIKASGTISIYEEDSEPYSYPIIVMFKKPDYLYIKAHKPLRPTIFTLISSADDFYIFIPQDNIIYTGNNQSLNNNPDYDISLTPEFFLQALFARSIPMSYPITMEQTSQDYILSVLNPNNDLNTITRKIWAEPPYFFCKKELHYSSKGVMLYEVKRDNFILDNQNQVYIPEIIFLRNTRTNVAIGLNLKKIFLNEEIEDSIFEFHFPEGVDVEKVE